MTNITLSIEDSVYKRMRKYSEIRWSEFVRKAIKHRLDELDTIKKHPARETVLTMLASQEVLREEWDNQEDERWNNV